MALLYPTKAHFSYNDDNDESRASLPFLVEMPVFKEGKQTEEERGKEDVLMKTE